jgi:hypothetical protein
LLYIAFVNYRDCEDAGAPIDQHSFPLTKQSLRLIYTVMNIIRWIEIGGNGPWRSFGPWLSLVLVAVVLPVLVLPLLLAAVLYALWGPATAVPIPAQGGLPGSNYARLSLRSPPLA